MYGSICIPYVPAGLCVIMLLYSFVICLYMGYTNVLTILRYPKSHAFVWLYSCHCEATWLERDSRLNVRAPLQCVFIQACIYKVSVNRKQFTLIKHPHSENQAMILVPPWHWKLLLCSLKKEKGTRYWQPWSTVPDFGHFWLVRQVIHAWKRLKGNISALLPAYSMSLAHRSLW